MSSTLLMPLPPSSGGKRSLMDLWVVHCSLLFENHSCSSVCLLVGFVSNWLSMWYCSVGKAMVLIASTFLGVEILLDQIADKRLTRCFITDLLL